MERLWSRPDRTDAGQRRREGAGGDIEGDSPPGPGDGLEGGLDDPDLVRLHADLAVRSRWVASNFVMAVDGAIALDGRSGGLGADGDLAVFQSLRAHADVVMAGAGTVRAESYGPTLARAVAARRSRGQGDRPRLVVVTRSAGLRELSRLWSDPDAPLSILTGTDAPDDEVAWLRERAEVLTVGDDGPDLAAGLGRLEDRGEGRILVEGGPSLQADLFDRGLLTDVFTTVAPQVVGGGQTSVPRVLARSVRLDLAGVGRHRDEVFLHHRARTQSTDPTRSVPPGPP